LGAVGVRIPENAVARALIAATDRPIAAPSANRSNRLSPTRAEHVELDIGASVDMIIDAGPCTAGVESTVLDLSGPEPVVLRPGPIGAEALSGVLGTTVKVSNQLAEEGSPQTSPGQSRLHYAPSKRLVLWISRIPLIEEIDPASNALMLLGPTAITQSRKWPESLIITRFREARSAERDLYATLHGWDVQPVIDEIHVVLLEDTRVMSWAAVRDRLLRAHSDIR